MACEQVLANDVNIGYEEITNTLVRYFLRISIPGAGSAEMNSNGAERLCLILRDDGSG